MKLIYILESEYGWFQQKHVYIALSIHYFGSKICVRVVAGDSGTPVLEPLKSFEVISGYIPSSWIFCHENNGVSLTPESWTAENFWPRYFDFDAEARQIFERESYQIVAEEA